MSGLDHHADRRWRAAHTHAEHHWLAEHAASAASIESHPLDPDATQRVDLVGTIAFHQVFEVARYLHDCIASGTRRFIVDVSRATHVARYPLALALSKVSRRASRAGGALVLVAERPETFSLFAQGDLAGLLDVVRDESAARAHLDRAQAPVGGDRRA
jgi:anti-anti-sigma regulatory factor